MSIFNDRVVFSKDDPDDIFNKEFLFEFNMPGNSYSRWWCDDIDGWKNTADLNVTLSTYGTADGAVPANRFPAKERYLTLQGACQSYSREVSEAQMDNLVSAVPVGVDFYIERYEPTPKRIKVRLASAIEFPQQFENEFRWMMTVVVPIPTKESLVQHSSYVNVYSGGLTYREYTGGLLGDTNWSQNPSFETDVTTGTSFINAAVLTKVSTPVSSGTGALKCVTSTQSTSGFMHQTLSRAPNAYDVGTWNAQIQLRGNVGGETVNTYMRCVYSDGTYDQSTATLRTLTTTYTAYDHQLVSDESKDLDHIELHVRQPGTTAQTLFADRPHINFGPSATASFTGTAYPGNSFHTGTANNSPVSRQAEPKSPGKRSYTSYARTYTQGISSEYESVIELATMNNAGNATAYPYTIVTGPLYSGSWELRNETSGDRLSFRVDIPEGSSLVIDHGMHTATLNGQSVEYRKDGTWWGLKPGFNKVRLASDEFNISAIATLYFHDAWRN